MRTLLTPAQNKLLITSMKRQGMALLFEIRIPVSTGVNAILPEETGQNPDSTTQFLTGSCRFEQFPVRTPSTRP